MSNIAGTGAKFYAVFCWPDDPTDLWAEPIAYVVDAEAQAFATVRGAELVAHHRYVTGRRPKLILIAERDDLPPELLPRRTMDQVLEMARKAVGGA